MTAKVLSQFCEARLRIKLRRADFDLLDYMYGPPSRKATARRLRFVNYLSLARQTKL